MTLAFDLALEKRMRLNTAAILSDVTGADTMLLHNSADNAVLRIDFDTLVAALSAAMVATPRPGAFTTISASGQITSTVSSGTAPLVIASTTAIPNLNASFLNGFTFANPGTIGTTPGAGNFTTLGASGLLSADGGQIKFPATENPSSDANTLDAYKEGSFTPTLLSGGAAVGRTYVSQVGSFTTFGNRTIIQGYIELSAKGSSTGITTIGGLPRTSNATSGHLNPLATMPQNITYAGTLIAYVNTNSNAITVGYVQSASSITLLQDTGLANNSKIHFQGTYENA